MTPNLDPSLLWVERRIRELSAELGQPVDCLEWLRPTDALYGQMMRARVVPLKIWRGGEFRIIEFKRSEFRDVEASKEIQGRLGERIREALRKN